MTASTSSTGPAAPGQATAESGINVALIKYWGKRDAERNLPAVGSLSLTLDAPGTRTTVCFDEALTADTFTLDAAPADVARVTGALSWIRRRVTDAGGRPLYAEVSSENTVPTAAGLASSASGFAALTVAAWSAAGLPEDLAAQAELARLGSGSAPRSLLGGLVELDRDAATVRPLLAPDVMGSKGWPLRMVIALAGRGPKKVGSRAGMASSEATSPYYKAWVETHEADMAAARAAIEARDLAALGEAMEHSTLKMHACMMAGRPALIYWRAATLAAVETVRLARADGRGAWFTMDAGPHVKVLCLADEAPEITRRLAETPGVLEVTTAAPGLGARLVETPVTRG